MNEQQQKKLEVFLTAYMECALWSSTDIETEKPLDKDHSESDISDELTETMRKDCEDFLFAHPEDPITRFLSTLNTNDTAHAGHDFWLTRNGHGAGFWDSDWPEEHEKGLTQRAKAYGTCDLVVGDDDLIYGA